LGLAFEEFRDTKRTLNKTFRLSIGLKKVEAGFGSPPDHNSQSQSRDAHRNAAKPSSRSCAILAPHVRPIAIIFSKDHPRFLVRRAAEGCKGETVDLPFRLNISKEEHSKWHVDGLEVFQVGAVP
jgi:hypothetical protein